MYGPTKHVVVSVVVYVITALVMWGTMHDTTQQPMAEKKPSQTKPLRGNKVHSYFPEYTNYENGDKLMDFSARRFNPGTPPVNTTQPRSHF